MIGTCLKSQDSSLQVGVHGCQALISDRNVFKESGFIFASWVMVGGGNMVTAFHTASPA